MMKLLIILSNLAPVLFKAHATPENYLLAVKDLYKIMEDINNFFTVFVSINLV